MRKGYLTVYLSLSLTMALTLILTLLEGARISTIRMETECTADIGMNSVLAEFHRELLEQYDLLFVDMSYGTASPSVDNSAEHLRHYMQKNFTPGEKSVVPVKDFLSLTVDKAVITDYTVASDGGGDVMKRQALAYMKTGTMEGALAGMAEKITAFKDLGLDRRNIESERNAIQAQIDAIELPRKENEKGELVEIALNNPADRVNAFRSGGVLALVVKDTSDISRAAIHTDVYASRRTLKSGTGWNPEFQRPGGMTDKLLFGQYLFEKCGSYGNEMEKSQLKYQIEYILEGGDCDWDNLKKVADKILAWREAANFIYLLSDSSRCMEAELLALTLTAVLQVPALKELVKYAILFAWAYVESLHDVRCLLSGGKVPLIKTGGEWKTGLINIIGFNGSVADTGGGGRGFGYEDYLRIMLFMEEDSIQNMRTLDIMEMDIRRTPGNQYFRMDSCFDSFAADLSVSSTFGYHLNFNKKYAYH